MLASKPAGSPYHLAAATTEIMWTCALVTARVGMASTARSLELWTQMLRSPPLTLPPPPALPGRAAAVPQPEAAAPTKPEGAGSPSPTAEPTPFASYRSSGGHAAAQVIVPD